MAKDFVFTYDGVQYWLDDLTVSEAVELEDQIGEWGSWRPVGIAKHRLTLMSVFLRRGRTEDDVAKILNDLTLGASRAMWALKEEDLPEVYEDGLPNSVAGPSTSTP